jgi:hypothetical protein
MLCGGVVFIVTSALWIPDHQLLSSSATDLNQFATETAWIETEQKPRSQLAHQRQPKKRGKTPRPVSQILRSHGGLNQIRPPPRHFV